VGDLFTATMSDVAEISGIGVPWLMWALVNVAEEEEWDLSDGTFLKSLFFILFILMMGRPAMGVVD